MAAISEPFALGTSIIHALDARIKILVALVFSVPVALTTSFTTACVAFVLACIALGMARLSPARLLRRLLAVNAFVAFLWLFLPFTTHGDALFALGPLTATRQGVFQALLLTLKSNAILLAFIALINTIPMQSLGAALQKLRVPDKLCHLLLFTYRYVHVIRQEQERLLQAAKIRGFTPGNNLHTWRTYAYFIGTLLVRSWDRAERVYQAMLCRGFKQQFYCLSEFSLQPRDWIFSVLSLVALTGIFLLELLY